MGLRGGGDRIVLRAAVVLLALIAAIVVVIAWALAAAPAEAQARCGLRENIVHLLTSQFRERQIGVGTQGGNLAELWASDETGSWTMLLTLPTGVSCIIGAGQSWTAGALPPPPDGEAM